MNDVHQNEWSGDSVSRLRLKAFSPQLVTETAQWMRKTGTTDFKIFSKPYTLSWKPPTLPAEPVSGAIFTLGVKNHNTAFEISIPYSLLAVWLMPYLDQVDLTSFDVSYQLILIEVALAELLSQFEAKMGYALTLCQGEAPLSYTHTETFLCQSGEGTHFPLIVRCAQNDHETMMAFFCDLSLRKPTCHANLRFQILAGITPLKREELACLKVGSIIQLTTTTDPLSTPFGLLEQSFMCPLHTGQGSMQAEMTDNLLSFDPLRKGLGMSTESHLQSTLESLKVPVYFELNHFDVPIDSLAHLQKGHVFNLNKPVDEGVDIVVNGRVVAKGEVVQIGQNYGILVQEIY